MLTAARRSLNFAGKKQPLLLFLTGIGFMVIGFRKYPAFIGVGSLFLIVSYRGFTCCPDNNSDQE